MKRFTASPLASGNGKLNPPYFEFDTRGVKYVEPGLIKSKQYFYTYKELLSPDTEKKLVGFSSIYLCGHWVKGFTRDSVDEMVRIVDAGKSNSPDLPDMVDEFVPRFRPTNTGYESQSEDVHVNVILDHSEDKKRSVPNEKQLNELMDVALSGGVVTEKERKILYKSAKLLGVDLDEFKDKLVYRLQERLQKKGCVFFFFYIEGKQQGPFELHALRKQVRRQGINPKTLVWRQGLTKWVPAGSLLELSNILK